jgi:transcriptional regulator with XRE-family HTH domain
MESNTSETEPNADAPPVDPASAIGARLAVLRASRGIRVSRLAREIGVSPSLISQIERGQSRPSVSTLFALSEALSVPVDAFFRDADKPGVAADDDPRPSAPSLRRSAAGRRARRYVVRPDERAVIDIEGGVRWERLTPTTLDEVEFLELVYGARAESNPSLYRHPGMEMVLVLSGRLDIFVAFERYELGPRDSICFASTMPHRYVNPTNETTRAVTVILPGGATEDPDPTERPMRP